MKAIVSVLNHGGLARFACALKSADSLRNCLHKFLYFISCGILYFTKFCAAYLASMVRLAFYIHLLSRLNSLLHIAILSTKFYIIGIQLALEF